MGMTDTATRLIKRFGQAATLTKTEAGGDNPWDDGEPTAVDYDVICAVTQFTLEELGTDMVTDADLRVFMAVADAAPEVGDTLTIGGQAYLIKKAAILGPDGVAICFELVVRA